MNQESKDHLDRLIQAQADWIKSLQANQEQLEKYRNGVLPINEKRITDIATAQRELAKAAGNIAEAIAGALNRA